MQKKTVRQRIFRNNALMLVATLAAFALVNLGIAKLYVETMEQKWHTSMEQILTDDQLEDFVADWTIQQREFMVLAVVDIVVCMAVLAVISYLFAARLSGCMMKPLHALADGANRVRQGRLSEPVPEQAEVEFNDTCVAFNEMQQYILEERQKNEQYEKARTDMISGISHDLRTPLTAARGAVKAVLDGVTKTPEQQEKFLHTAYRRIGEMDGLLNQLLYMSRMETGNLPMQLEILDMAAFMSRFAKETQETEDDHLQIQADVPEEPLYVLADPQQLKRMFDNLLENSLKYSNADPLQVTIRARKEGTEVRICFADNGDGVAEDKLSVIFEQFYRVDPSRNRKEGHGLGLYIVRYLVEAMGGQVSAYNRDGLCIEMRFPFQKKYVEAENSDRK